MRICLCHFFIIYVAFLLFFYYYIALSLFYYYIYIALYYIYYIYLLLLYIYYILYIYSSSIIYVLQFSYNTLRHLSHLLIQYNIDFTILYSYAFISHLDENDTLEYLMIKRHFVV